MSVKKEPASPLVEEPRKVALFYTAGSSDKEYRVEIRSAGSGTWLTLAFNGRRGGTLVEQKKTKQPVDYSTAYAIYAQVIAQKTRKGYVEDTSGTIYQDLQSTGDRKFSGFVPQLLNSIRQPIALASAIADDKMLAQEKHDGERRPIRFGFASKNAVEGINKEGLVAGLTAGVEADVRSLGVERVHLDGEIMGERYVAFDLLHIDKADLRTEPYALRLAKLESLLSGRNLKNIECVKTAFTSKDKRALLDNLRAHNGEGIVFKDAAAPYTPGRPASGGAQLKFKFTEQCTVVVTGHTAKKRSVAMSALTDEGNDLVKVGNVSIPPSASIPGLGALVNVEYLYRYPNGSLFQPVYQGERKDQSRPDRVGSLKLKAEHAYAVDGDDPTPAVSTDPATPPTESAQQPPKKASLRKPKS